MTTEPLYVDLGGGVWCHAHAGLEFQSAVSNHRRVVGSESHWPAEVWTPLTHWLRIDDPEELGYPCERCRWNTDGRRT